MLKRLQDNLSFVFILIFYCLYAAFFIYRTSFVIDGTRYYCLFDDMMISMRYAKNLAAGYGFTWNPGDAPIEGFTNMLWVLYMALFHLLSISPSKISLAIQVSGAICLIANLFVVRKIALHISRDNSIVASCAVLLTAFYLPLNNWALQGVEVGVLTLILSICIWKSLRCLGHDSTPFVIYILLGIATLIRVDMVVPLIAVTGFLFFVDTKHRIRHLGLGIGTFIIFVCGQTLFRYLYFGDIFPNTYYLKICGYPLYLRICRGVYVFFNFVLKANWILFLVPFGLLYFRRKKSVFLLLWVFLSQVAYSIYVGGDAWEFWGGSNRYISMAIPGFFILFSYGLYELIQWVARNHFEHKGKYVAMLFTIIAMLNFNAIRDPRAWGEWLLIIRPLHVDLNMQAVQQAHAIKQITTKDAEVGVVLAGALPYFVDRHFVDILGKSDAKIAHLPMRVPQEKQKYIGFYPGHMKWDYEYSIGHLKPDVIIRLWRSPEEARPLLDRYYVCGNANRLKFYLLRQSDRVHWNRITQVKLIPFMPFVPLFKN